MRYLGEVSVVVGVLAVGWTATYGVDLINGSSSPPPTENSSLDRAKDCQVNGEELSKSLPAQTKKGLIRSITETAPRVITIIVGEQSWARADDEDQAAIEIGAYCRIIGPRGEGTVIIRGASQGKELERIIDGGGTPGLP